MLYSDEKLFGIDGVYNAQNDRVCAYSHTKANESDGIRIIKRFSAKVMVWLDACSQGITPLVIFKEDALNHNRYTKEVLPVALKYGEKVFGNDSTFQQDGTTVHTHHLSQK